MEYVQRGSMLNYLRKCRPSSRVSCDSAISSLQTNSSFMEPRAKDLSIFALQIARGMAHIAAIGVSHNDPQLFITQSRLLTTLRKRVF